MTVEMIWRGRFENDEVNRLHAEAFNTRVFDASEWNWEQLVGKHSVGWVTASVQSELVGFVNVIWDGLVHAWIQDVMVATSARRHGVGRRLVDAAAQGARD